MSQDANGGSMRRADEPSEAELKGCVALLEGMAGLDACKPGHGVRVARLCESFAAFLKLAERRRLELRLAALAHDLGELALNEEYRRTPQVRLRAAVRPDFRDHPQRAAALLEAAPALRSAAAIVAAHHERYDGAGFPHGLRGDAIPILARVLAVVDTYDEARHGYIMPQAMAEAEVREYLRSQRSRQLDPRVVHTFLRWRAQVEEQAREGAGEEGLSVDLLRPGMILDEDLCTRGGIFLVPAGHRLTPALIDRIRALAAREPGELRARVRQPL